MLTLSSVEGSAFVNQQFSEGDRTAAVGQMIAVRLARRGESKGGKSELRRAVRRVTPGQGNLKESGTENTQLTPAQVGKQW